MSTYAAKCSITKQGYTVHTYSTERQPRGYNEQTGRWLHAETVAHTPSPTSNFYPRTAKTDAFFCLFNPCWTEAFSALKETQDEISSVEREMGLLLDFGSQLAAETELERRFEFNSNSVPLNVLEFPRTRSTCQKIFGFNFCHDEVIGKDVFEYSFSYDVECSLVELEPKDLPQTRLVVSARTFLTAGDFLERVSQYDGAPGISEEDINLFGSTSKRCFQFDDNAYMLDDKTPDMQLRTMFTAKRGLQCFFDDTGATVNDELARLSNLLVGDSAEGGIYLDSVMLDNLNVFLNEYENIIGNYDANDIQSVFISVSDIGAPDNDSHGNLTEVFATTETGTVLN